MTGVLTRKGGTGMKIIVTGGAGFIASNVVDAYIEAGHDVAVIDNLYSGKRENLNPKARFYLLDVRSPEVRKVFEFERPDVVNHHAAQMSVPFSVKDPMYDADVNVRGFLNVLEAAREFGAKKVIFISSGGAIYGEAVEYPTSEQCPPQPLSPYAVTKAVSEQYLAFYNHQYGLDYTALRYANVYGPRQMPHGEAGVVSIFMDRLLSGDPCTLYHFKDEPQGMSRDYCCVLDVVRANLLVLTSGGTEAFNIGTGTPTATEDLFRTIFEAVKGRIPSLDPGLGALSRADVRPGDIRRSCLNADKASKALGWRAQIGLKDGIELTLDWRLGQRK